LRSETMNNVIFEFGSHKYSKTQAQKSNSHWSCFHQQRFENGFSETEVDHDIISLTFPENCNSAHSIRSPFTCAVLW
jgi:hypothetical protein